MIEQEVLLTNPFPGLRPFRMEESEFFFGRDGQSDQVLTKLRTARFVAVVGTSGSGKSSLVNAGLLPALFSGHLPSAGSSWRVASFRPGSSPIANLAEVLNAPGVCGVKDKDASGERLANIERTLRRSSLGLLEVVSQSKLQPGENLLILADQFEELFRFRKKSTAAHPEDEAAAFVKLLLETKQPEKSDEERLPIYVILTMRSDHLGDCAHYWGLPEAINEGQFLIPRMTDDNRREAITGPIIIGGAEITAPLVNLLLNDAGDDPAQLPILQHALMRTWDYWKNQCQAQGPIDIPHYREIGGMKDALSRHADEAFFELSPELQNIAAKVFKALTEKEADNREGRRPATVNEIAVAAGCSEEQVKEVVEKFRSEGRSFLVPSPPAELASKTLIDISHESLIRGWGRLRTWVDEEAEAARQYVRLADKAAFFPEGEDFLRDPALSAGLKWLEDNRPTKAWAERYHAGFDKTIEYLDLSKKNRQDEIDLKEKQHKEEAERELRHAQALAAEEQRNVKLRNWAVGGLVMLLIVMAGITVYAFQQKGVAQRQTRDAEIFLGIVHEIDKAAPYFNAVIRGHNDSVTDAWIAGNDEIVFTQSADHTAQMWDARIAVPDFVDQPYLADRVTIPVLYSRDGKLALLAKYPGHSGTVVWDIPARKELLELPWTNVDAGNTLISPNGQLVLHYDTSKRSFGIFHVRTGRSVSWDDNYTANGEDIYPTRDLSKVALSDDGSLLGFALGSGAGVIITDTGKGLSLTGHLDEVKSIAFSRDNKFVVTASKDGTAKVWDARNGIPLVTLSGHEGPVNSAEFSDDSKYIVTTSEKLAYLWEAKSPGAWTEVTEVSPNKLAGHTDLVTNAAFSPDGKWVATVSQDRTAQLWDAKVIDLNLRMKVIASVDNAQTVNLPTTARSLAVFRGHIKALTSVDFSPDSKFLVTGSEDRTARIWDLRSFGAFTVATTQLVANPAEYSGKCPANVTFTGTISVSGRSGSVEYKFVRSDGSESLPQQLTFDGPGSTEVSETREIFSKGVDRGGNPLPVAGWVAVEILQPTALRSNQADYTVKCSGNDFAELQRRDLSASELQQIMPGSGQAQRELYLPYLQKAMDEFGINTPLRRAAFLAEVAQNTAQLSQLVELGNDAALENRYGSRKELGNYEPGDGARFKGRGAIQITGRAQYQAFGAQLGVDLLADPEKAAAPDVAFRTAALYWQKNGLNEKADQQLLTDIHRRVQGGLNGLQAVQNFYERAKRVLGAE